MPKSVLLVILLAAIFTGGVLAFRQYGQPSGGSDNLAIHKLPAGDVAFNPIPTRTGGAIGYPRPTNIVTNDQASWSGVWTQAFCHTRDPCPTLPEVNFTQWTVLVVFMGEKGTSGYSTKVARVSSTGDNVIVDVLDTVPTRGCIEAQSLTYPYDIVEIPKSGQPVSFITQSIAKC